jgi:hypothetical protein
LQDPQKFTQIEIFCLQIWQPCSGEKATLGQALPFYLFETKKSFAKVLVVFMSLHEPTKNFFPSPLFWKKGLQGSLPTWNMCSKLFSPLLL